MRCIREYIFILYDLKIVTSLQHDELDAVYYQHKFIKPHEDIL